VANTLKVPITDRDHIQGNRNAAVALLEYGDYECPHCGRAHFIVKALQKTFAENMAFVFRNFPLAQIHPHAQLAAEAAEAAGSQGKYWKMHDWLFENQSYLSPESILEAAQFLALDTERFLSEIETHVHAEKIRADFLGGVRSGVNGTPTFFINGVRHDADFEFETLAAALSIALEEAA
jgi:protein-disulfide isomerase